MNVISLKDWLELAERRGVDFILAELIATPVKDDVIRALDGDECQTWKAAYRELRADASRRPARVQRFDCCASTDLKSTMAKGVCRDNESRHITTVDDPRLIDILFEYPGETVPIWSRPWVEPLNYGGYPIEFRVYWDRGIKGISNYYPQIDLSVCENIGEEIGRVIDAALRMNPPVECSMDFLIKPNRMPVFLEGGPPHTEHGGAHPCCFEPGKVAGIALGKPDA